MGALADLLKSGSVDGEESAAQLPEDTPDRGGAGEHGAGPIDELPPDPQPSRRTAKGRRRTARAASPRKASKAEQDQVRDALTMLYTLPAWGLQLRDAHCGGALMDQRDAIIDALTPIVCRNPAMLAFFTAANAPWMDYLALFQALLPVGQAVWGHHVTRTVGRDESAGGVPVDLSAYAAPAFG